MSFMKVFIETKPQALEALEGLLYEQEVPAWEASDPQDFDAFLHDPNRTWDYMDDGLREEKLAAPTGVTFYLSESPEGQKMLEDVKAALNRWQKTETELDLGSLAVTVEEHIPEDWSEQWKKYFKPFPVGQTLLVRPTWEPIPEGNDRKVLTLDPGHVFGSGSHETTCMCLEHLERCIAPGDKVFDIGCGSGILSIASLLLGASEATAIDIDPEAAPTAAENAAQNGFGSEVYHVLTGNITRDRELERSFHGQNFDVVTANIVANIIIILCRRVAKCIKPGGYFVASGIIQDRMEDVQGVMALNGFVVEDITMKGEWVAMTARYEGK